MAQDITVKNVGLSVAHHRLEQMKREMQLRLHPNEANSDFIPRCKTCATILRVFYASEATDIDTDLGSWESLTVKECESHRHMFPANDTLVGRQIFLRRIPRQNLLYLYPNPYIHKKISTLDAPWEWFQPSKPKSIFSETPWKSEPRIVDPAWIDLGLLTTWMSECREKHGGICNTRDAEDLPPILLVDVQDRCLVWSHGNVPYIALSYVWGGVNRFVTSKDELPRLLVRGALDDDAVMGALPKTVAQAIKLTEVLGERYIWLDALSIVQDSKEKYAQLNAMASIFANAVLTIVAADGADADAGFRGLPGVSEPRCLNQYVAPLISSQQLVKPSSKQVWHNALLEPWSKRAWTFQEALLSRRILYFAHDSVRWQCQHARWSEESNSPDCLLSHGTVEQQRHYMNTPHLAPGILPCFFEYERLVNGFNCRDLTYPEDALSAFAGVDTRLGRKFAGGLISGLPAHFFDLCLLWQPLRSHSPAVIRKPRVVSKDFALPSWSWVGWVTEIAFPYTWTRSNDPMAPAPVLLGAIRPFYQTEFFHIDHCGAKMRIPCNWLDYGSPFVDDGCPPGWKRKTKDFSETSDYGRLIDVPYFEHASNPTLAFWFPIPLSKTTSLPLMASKICFRTTVGTFKLGEVRRCTTQIQTLDGQHAGTLWQHDEDDAGYVSALQEAGAIELVAILGCVVSKDDQVLWGRQHVVEVPEEEPTRTREVYNVLWIQRDGDVAYRKGTGEIERQVWDSVAGDEMVEVTLC